MKKWIFLTLCVLSSSVFADEMISKVIPVSHVSTELLVKTLQPMLGKGESISAFENKLVVKVSPETLTQIRPIIHQLDKPKPIFEISIHQGPDDWLDEGYQRANVYSTNSIRKSQDNQSIQVLSGSSAYVSTGSNVPVLSYGGVGWFGAGVGYDRMDIKKGFFITPTLQGDSAQINIKRVNSERSLVNQESVNEGAYSTTTTVPLNKWVKLGSQQAGSPQNNGDNFKFQAGGQYGYKGSLYIKVSVIRK